MPVTFDATAEKAGSVSPIATSSLTVANNGSRVMIAVLGMNSTPTSAVVRWDTTGTPQSLSLITDFTSTAGFYVSLYGLINPRSGNLTLQTSVTGAGTNNVLGAVSLFNADQVTGWNNVKTTSGNSTAPTIKLTGAAGTDMAVAGHFDENSALPVSFTVGSTAWVDTAADGNFAQGYNGSTGTLTMSLASAVAWSMVGANVLATAAGAAGSKVTPRSFALLGVGA